jgi:hypothetical protein
MKRLSYLHVPHACRFGATVSSLFEEPRERRAQPADGKPCKLLILNHELEGAQTSMATHTNGDFIALDLLPRGQGWILAIGTDLKPTHPDDRSSKQATQ